MRHRAAYETKTQVRIPSGVRRGAPDASKNFEKRRMIMKKMRKIAALVAAMAMTATMAVPFTAMATSQSVPVSVSTNGTGTNNEGTTPKADVVTHTYTAYEIFKGENVQTAGADTQDTTDDTYEFKVTGFGSGVNWSVTNGILSNATFKAYKLNDKTIDQILQDLTGKTTYANEDITGKEATIAPTIARVLGEIASATPAADSLAKLFDQYKTTGTAITAPATNMTEGYYLITDTYTPATNGSNDALSKFILQVAKKQGDSSITIVPKKSYPTVEKKVKEDDKNVTGKPINDANTLEKWNDVADYDIGEAVPFKLYGTLPATINDYSAYYYKFTDNLGTQFDQPTSLTIKIGTKTLTATLGNSGYTVTGDETGEYNCRVKWENHVLTITFEDIKKYYTANAQTGKIPVDDIITVEYNAVLNNTASIGLPGQENAVNLTYSNNPNFVYTPTTTDDKEDTPKDDNNTPGDTTDDKENTDKTPDDKVIVFTYELDVTKIDGVTKEKLQGAVFNLKNGTKFAKVDSNGKFLAWVDAAGTDENGTTSLTSDANGLFTVSGIDDDTYSLVEVTPPTGYNPLTAPISVTISATTANDQAWAFIPSNALTAFKVNGTAQDEGKEIGNRGHAALEVENNKGSVLPSTGGMGTTLFYLAGGVMVIGAGVVLVTKKRTRKED